MGDGNGDSNSWTYGEYLRLYDLLKLQGEGREISSDEMHFIIVHQTFELWFKQIIRELSEARGILSLNLVPEEKIPSAVDHLSRTTEIFRLMADQWTVLETLTPQGFLNFRDDLGTASGFESFQMREFEILLGLKAEDRVGGMDPIGTFRKLSKRSPEDVEILSRLERRLSEKSLYDALMEWIERTPIMGSSIGDEGDEKSVRDFILNHLEAYKMMNNESMKRLESTTSRDEIAKRFRVAEQSAESFLLPDGKIDRARAGLLFIESYRELPLLTWPRKLIDAFVELEESMAKWRHDHARMVERIIGRRTGTGGTSGVDYLDSTSKYRIFRDLWEVRTILVKPDLRPILRNAEFYSYSVDL